MVRLRISQEVCKNYLLAEVLTMTKRFLNKKTYISRR